MRAGSSRPGLRMLTRRADPSGLCPSGRVQAIRLQPNATTAPRATTTTRTPMPTAAIVQPVRSRDQRSRFSEMVSTWSNGTVTLLMELFRVTSTSNACVVTTLNRPLIGLRSFELNFTSMNLPVGNCATRRWTVAAVFSHSDGPPPLQCFDPGGALNTTADRQENDRSSCACRPSISHAHRALTY
jgi:hypothetical protein